MATKAAGKKDKTKAAPSSSASEQQSGAHLDAPSAVAHPAADQPSGVTAINVKPGAVALVRKGGDRVPVQLKDDAHLEQLKREHGEGAVEVQS